MHTATVVPSLASKTEIRRQALARRDAYAGSLTPELRGNLDARLAARVLPHLRTATAVAGYSAMISEIDPSPILDAIAAAGCLTALPWFADRDAPMIFRAAPAVEIGPWRILQPGVNADAVRPDVVLVPLVAVDTSCNRIGHGKGHYDRALANLRAGGNVRTIGLAWDEQVLDTRFAPDPWDIPLDAVATPDRWIERTP